MRHKLAFCKQEVGDFGKRLRGRIVESTGL